MSITFSYRRLSPAEFAHLQADPEAADHYFGDDLYDEEGIPLDEEASEAYLDARDASGRYLTIGKSWHGLHLLLTGDGDLDHWGQAPPPLGNVVQGGADTGWEASYGNIRYLTIEEVRSTAVALASLNEETLRNQFDLSAFQANNIYPGGETWDEDCWPYLYTKFTQVRDFFVVASAAGEMILLSSD